MNKTLFGLVLLLAFAFESQATIVTGIITNSAGTAINCKVNFTKLGTTAGDGMVMTRSDMFQRETVAATGAFSIDLTAGLYMMSLFDGTIFRQHILSVAATDAYYTTLQVWKMDWYVSNGANLTNIAAANIAAYGTLPVLNAASLTNIPATGLSSAVLRLLATNNAASLTNIPATGLTSAVLMRLATNNAVGLTNITASSTNADTATIATWVTGNGAALTNQIGAQAYLTVNGATDGIQVAFRAVAAQTNPVFAVQTSVADSVFAVGPQGALFLATNAVSGWPTNANTFGGAAFVNSNSTVFLLTSGPNTKAWALTNKIAGP
jgi:hypothetical protein